jgi:hypothetical protein
MIVIIEGPDGAGKTTLAKELAERFELEYHHEGPSPLHNSLLEHYGKLFENARIQKRGVVFDRFALGERVYGPILRGQDRLGADGWKLMLRLITAVNAIQIFCLPPFEVCRVNWEKDKGIITSKEILYETYLCWQVFSASQITYNYANADPKWNEFSTLLHAIKLFQGNAKPLPVGIIGSPTAKYLFVGDVGSNKSAHVDLPFFATVNSSEYLNEALEQAGYEEHEIALANAHRHDALKQELPTTIPRIIALGARADQSLNVRGIAHQTAPHPQYWKRFFHHDMKGYVQMLRALREDRLW